MKFLFWVSGSFFLPFFIVYGQTDETKCLSNVSQESSIYYPPFKVLDGDQYNNEFNPGKLTSTDKRQKYFVFTKDGTILVASTCSYGELLTCVITKSAEAKESELEMVMSLLVKRIFKHAEIKRFHTVQLSFSEYLPHTFFSFLKKLMVPSFSLSQTELINDKKKPKQKDRIVFTYKRSEAEGRHIKNEGG